MKDVNIRGKDFTVKEICDYGNKSIKQTRKILNIVGLSCISVCLFMIILYIPFALSGEISTFEMLTSGIYHGIAGIILLILSYMKAKKDVYAEGIKFLNKKFPYPVGFDGNIIELLQSDKTIQLSEKPISKLIISSSENKIQIFHNNKYSKIFTSQDIIDYEIKVDNEVVITSKTKSKKGVGKALIGGALFGGVGLVAGAIAGNSKAATNQSQKEVHHYILTLTVNDIINPAFVIELSSLQIAEEVVATFVILCHNESQFKEDLKIIEDSKLDKFEEIKKYKELLDIGIITQEEFEIEKKKILK